MDFGCIFFIDYPIQENFQDLWVSPQVQFICVINQGPRHASTKIARHAREAQITSQGSP